MKAQSTF